MQVPVAEGAQTTLNGLSKTRVADFVHGTDGFGNTSQEAVQVNKIDSTADLATASGAL